MKKIIYYSLVLLFISILGLGCENEITPSLYQQQDPGATPVIASIDPPNSALAGVSVVTINGSDFSSDPSMMIVYFNSEFGQIIQASPNQLLVKVPNLVSDSVAIRITKIGTERFSPMVQYQLTPAFAVIKKDLDVDLFTENITPYGLTSDAQGNLYTSVSEFNANIGIKKISPSGIIVPVGSLEDFAPPGGAGGSFFYHLNMWQNNTIIAARRVAAIFQVKEGEVASVFASQLMQGTSMYDIDFDPNLNVWAGGRGSAQGGPSLFRITPASEVKSFSYFNLIKSVRVFNNHLYVLTTVNGEDLIKRFPIISGDSLGTAEDVLNISQSVLPESGTTNILGTDFDIAEDGDIIVGTTRNTDPIIVIHQDGSFESLYPGVVPQNTRVYAFSWGPDQYLYFTREERDVNGDGTIDMLQLIARLDMQKQGATYFGR
jgi:hypothetical protein